MGFIESSLRSDAKRSEIEDLLKTLILYSDNSYIHAVYSEPESDENYVNGQLKIEKDKKDPRNDMLRFSKLNFEHPFDFRFPGIKTPMQKLPRSCTTLARNTPRILERYKPRRIIIQDQNVLRQVDQYIGEPYSFIGFEVGLVDLGIRIFATTRDKKAGLKLYSQKKDAGYLANVLNEVVDPKIVV